MDEDIYEAIKEQLTEDLGREPTDDEITDEYSAQCDWAYENMKDNQYNEDGSY